MVKKHKKALFIFRRDLRLDDNLGLIEALKSSNSVIPCFILDPRQASPHDYFSENAFQFMVESLLDLKKQLREKNAGLYVFQGMAEEIVKYLLSEEKIDAVYFNCDYSPFSNKRDAAIGNICNRRQIEMLQFHDAFLNPPDYVLKDNGKPYAKFTPFHKKSQQFPISKPQKNRYDNYYRRQISINQQDILDNLVENPNERIHIHGGRGSALKILSKIREFENYEFQRDIPVLNATTSLSAHNKFGTVSINEVYYAVYNKLGEDHPLIRQLYWRDFFSYIGYFFPHVFGNSFNQIILLMK